MVVAFVIVVIEFQIYSFSERDITNAKSDKDES